MNTFTEFRQIAHASKTDKMSKDRFYNLEREVSIRVSWLVHKCFPHLKPSFITLISLIILLVVFLLTIKLANDISSARTLALSGLILLYVISITDKMDGELARVSGLLTQKGLHYDRAVHFIYPYIFYFLVGTYFYIIHGHFAVLALTVLAAILTQEFLFLSESKLLIAEKIRKEQMPFTDLYSEKRVIGRAYFPFRIADYMTFMIYAWVLFFYFFLVYLSGYFSILTYGIFISHLLVVIAINGYKVFVSYPRYRLLTKEDGDNLRGSK